MTDTIEERARELATSTVFRTTMPEGFTDVITAALRAEYERGQRDMRDRAKYVPVNFDVATNAASTKRLTDSGLLSDLADRDLDISRAIAALPITPDSEIEDAK